MSKIRQAARGQQCQIRLPGICDRSTETVVLAHYRMAGTCGMGIKPRDFQAAFACHSCHSEADRRTQHMDADEVQLYFAEGVMRTQQILFEMGLLKEQE